MGSFKSENLKILRIEIIKFWLNDEIRNDSNSVLIESDKTEIGFNIEKNIAKVIFEIKLGGKCDCSFKIAFTFEIKNLSEMVVIDENDEATPSDKNFYPHLFAITYSTIRGIIFTKTLGTHLQGLILPVVHPKRFYRKYLKEIEEEGSDLEV